MLHLTTISLHPKVHTWQQHYLAVANSAAATPTLTTSLTLLHHLQGEEASMPQAAVTDATPAGQQPAPTGLQQQQQGGLAAALAAALQAMAGAPHVAGVCVAMHIDVGPSRTLFSLLPIVHTCTHT